jgi:hypothetical protein
MGKLSISTHEGTQKFPFANELRIGRIDDFRTSALWIRDATTSDVQDRKVHYHYYF